MGTYAGKYDNLLAIYRPTETRSSTGQASIVYEEYVTEVPCGYKPKTGNENNENEQRVAYNTFVFTMHYPHSFEVNATMQLLYEGEYYNIDNVREAKNGRKVELEITATKKDNQ